MDDRTRSAKAGASRADASKPRQGEPVRPPVVAASVYELAGDPQSVPHRYGRLHNPTWEALETALGELDGGVAVAFSSGMAAIGAVLMSQLRPGDAVSLPSDGYYTVRNLAGEYLREIGVDVRYAPTAAAGDAAQASGAKLVWLETPCNPGLDVADIAATAAACHEQGALLAVDNTVATPFGQRPLALGADYAVCSLTKAIGGHSDLVLGAVVARDDELAGPIRRWRELTGAVPGPHEAWLAQRSLMTLALRVEAQAANAAEVASWLAEREGLGVVRYPGLVQDPSFAVASRQMSHCGCLVTFDLGDAERAERFLAGLELIRQTTSFGGVESTAERRARWRDDRSPPGLIRLSVGCEAAADLVADLDRALSAT